MAASSSSDCTGSDYVAPLHVAGRNLGKRGSVVNFQRPQLAIPSNTMTPPLTPKASDDNLLMPMAANQPAPFSDYWRAHYSYYPPYEAESTTVTLPLNIGDILLVHSIHDNGWADGTLLNSGIRGWFPTNYCEAYDHEPLRSLLKALTNFFDIVRSGTEGDVAVFCNQDYMRGLVAGVRYLLEKTGCLSRDAPMMASCLSLRRNRKALLADLSTLVRIAKELQSELTATHARSEFDRACVDDMVLRAFKLVLRAAKFHDVWLQVVIDEESVDGPLSPLRPGGIANVSYTLSNVGAEASRRDSAVLTDAHCVTRQGAGHEFHMEQSESTGQTANNRQSQQFPRMPSPLFSQTPHSSRPHAAKVGDPTTINRSSVSHRISYASNFDGVCRENLASERLSQAHEGLLTSLGGFISIHVSSRTSQELIAATQECVQGAEKFLDVLRAIWERGYYGLENIHEIAENMMTKVTVLIDAVQAVFVSLREPDNDDQRGGRRHLTDAATACIRAAGDGFSKGQHVLEMIGDFEFEKAGTQSTFEGTDLVSHETSAPDAAPALRDSVTSPAAQCPTSEVVHPQPTNEPPIPPSLLPAAILRTDTSRDLVKQENEMVPLNHRTSNGSWLPPLPRLASPVCTGSDPHRSYMEMQAGSPIATAGADSVRKFSIMSGSTFAGSKRDSDGGSMSIASTRAASPEPLGSSYKLEVCKSNEHVHGDENDEDEEKVLEKTYAHQLLFNKDGQIMGGTLPALVERLTTHDSSPDAMFVSTFYLTFRCFASPQEFAQALVDRFTYVYENKEIAYPVQLCVSNVLKCWLESHWRPESDKHALDIITTFARGPLTSALPSAGKQVIELTEKVTSTTSTLVPRLLSSISKANPSSTGYVPASTPLPKPLMSKSQTNLLRAWKFGKGTPSLLDFEPVELARQLTLKGSSIFCSISPEELLGLEWTKKSGSIAFNVRASSTLANDLASLVVDSIISLEDANRRAKVTKQWIKIAHACLELNNYDSLLAIVASLKSSTISRLHKTWDAVSPKWKTALAELNLAISCQKNFSGLRRRLTETAAPCLPYLGIYLTDLTFVTEGNPDLRCVHGDAGPAVINFDKHAKTARIIGELQRFQTPYRLAEVPELQIWIQDQLVRVRSKALDVARSGGYWRKSLALEPRESSGSPVVVFGSSYSPNGEKFVLGQKGGIRDLQAMLRGALGKGPIISRRPSLAEDS